MRRQDAPPTSPARRNARAGVGNVTVVAEKAARIVTGADVLGPIAPEPRKRIFDLRVVEVLMAFEGAVYGQVGAAVPAQAPTA